MCEPGVCTAPSPSITWMCRTATWPEAGESPTQIHAANRRDIFTSTELVRRSGEFSHQYCSDVIRSAGFLGGGDQFAAALFERRAVAPASQDPPQLPPIDAPGQAVAADQQQGAIAQLDRVVVDGEWRAGSDGHRQDVAHGMVTQALFVQAEGPADFVNPRLVFCDDAQTVIVQHVYAAVADTRDGKAVFQIERGYQRRPHAFQSGIAMGC